MRVNVPATDPRLEAVTRRLYGSANRVSWSAGDVERIAARLGVAGLAVPSVVARTVQSSPAAAPVIRAAEDASRQFTFVISTGSVDRSSDSIAVDGWQLGNYQKNPVVLWSHLALLTPIGVATRTWREGGRLKSTVQLAPADANDAAEQVHRLISGGFIFAASVGFAPITYAFAEDAGRKYGINFLTQELLEWSVVSVPANAECLVTGKSAVSSTAESEPRERRKRKMQRDLDLIRLRAGA